MFISLKDNRKTACNTGFASGGVTCKLGALCFYSSAVLVDSFVLRNPPERKARNRYSQPMNPKFNSLNQTNMRDNFNVDDILNKNRLDTQNYINKMVAFNKQLTFSNAKADSLIADDLLEMVNKHRYLHGENIRDLFITFLNQIKKQYLIADTPNKVREISNSLVTYMATEATILNNGGYSATSINT